MAPYTEIDTPINEYFDPYYEPEDYYFWDEDPHKQVQQRMLFVLGAVSVLVIAFALLVVPKWVGVGGGLETVPAANTTDSVAAELVLDEPQEANIAPAANTASGAIAQVFTPEVRYWETQILGWAEEYNLDPDIIATIMQIESCGNPNAVSVAGAQGLFQVMPFHFSGGEQMQDPDTNARRGMNFYNEQLRYTGGDIYLSFAGYNGGYAASGGNYANWPNETQRYHNWAKGIYDDAKAGLTSSPALEEWLAAGGAPGCQIAASRLGVN